ncbi:methyl-accepting chemotaxis protein [Caulobacter vibrioides]|uniref:methyl-accepting chemotaxis protein n=1 Tax=Caulobacter vibrioides TaxID=155892 RepID=UPI000BB4B4FC|nr:methyl-accepting chemotaxis protein [Caulobacter vibrioides]ATC25753.1 methyl-accepting chemotaxis protein [Caulobacter vibrioides]AZH13898.1 methyl-accepting chemotaxis protein [Caulobacter vibrioides]PLR07621.1 methyl-accepting chemotaxis protein [Caulobacter vibrioides]
MNVTFSNLDAQRQIGGKLIIALAWLLIPIVLGARLAVQAPILGLSIAAVLVATGATLAWKFAGGGSGGRAMVGVALMAQVSLLVAALGGHAWQADMHMAYFAALALLVVYCDWVVIAAAAATVAVHHLGLSYLAPSLVFPGSANLGRVIVHAVILIVEAAALIAVAASVNNMFAIANTARSKAEDAVGEARAANDAAEDARRSEEETRARNAAAREREEAQRDNAIAALGQGLSHLARGDLTLRLTDRFAEAYEPLRADFNTAAGKLADALSVIEQRVSGVRAGADQIADAALNLSRRTERQAASLEETAAAMDEITATVGQTATGANKAADVVSRAREDARRSGEVVEQAVSAMTGIEESSQSISQIISVIDEIAFQTNLLALNAGVEAARAGEAGRGFAVVAQEVRALAQRSAEAAKEIRALISNSTQQVETGVNLVGRTGEALERIVAQIAEIDGLVRTIAASAQEQASGLAQINGAVNQMDQVLQENAGMVEETSAATQTLNTDAAQLADLVRQFDLPRGHIELSQRRVA